MTICSEKKVFISSNLTIVLLPFPCTRLPSSSLLNACFFYFLEKSEFPIKQKKHLRPQVLLQSDRRGSNPRPRPWQGRTLPTEPLSHFLCSVDRNNRYYTISIFKCQQLFFTKADDLLFPSIYTILSSCA